MVDPVPTLVFLLLSASDHSGICRYLRHIAIWWLPDSSFVLSKKQTHTGLSLRIPPAPSGPGSKGYNKSQESALRERWLPATALSLHAGEGPGNCLLAAYRLLAGGGGGGRYSWGAAVTEQHIPARLRARALLTWASKGLA